MNVSLTPLSQHLISGGMNTFQNNKHTWTYQVFNMMLKCIKMLWFCHYFYSVHITKRYLEADASCMRLCKSRWRHDMETLHASRDHCGGRTGHCWFSSQRASNVFFFTLMLARTSCRKSSRVVGDLRRHDTDVGLLKCYNVSNRSSW